MIMEIQNDYYESLLDDPVESQEEQIEEHEIDDNEPLLPDQPSDEGSDEPKHDETEEQPEVEDDLMTSYLKSYGIADPTKIQFENEEGGIDEVDFNSLPKEEQLTMLQELASSNYTDYEKNVIQYLRVNNISLENLIAFYQNKAIEDYLAQNPDKTQQKEYKIDDFSDDELYIADIAAKFPDFTEEELNSRLESAKINEELFKKEVDSLRQFYKAEEDRQAEEAKNLEQQQYEALQNSLLDAANKFNEVVLDLEDPQSDALEIEDSDKQRMLDYLLTPDKDGQSQFDKDLSDPAALIELAWLRTQGRDTIAGVTQYWKKELADTRKELAKAKKELEKYRRNDSNDKVTVNETKPTSKRPQAKSVSELWG
jgi:hypothetical protein